MPVLAVLACPVKGLINPWPRSLKVALLLITAYILVVQAYKHRYTDIVSMVSYGQGSRAILDHRGGAKAALQLVWPSPKGRLKPELINRTWLVLKILTETPQCL